MLLKCAFLAIFLLIILPIILPFAVLDSAFSLILQSCNQPHVEINRRLNDFRREAVSYPDIVTEDQGVKLLGTKKFALIQCAGKLTHLLIERTGETFKAYPLTTDLLYELTPIFYNVNFKKDFAGAFVAKEKDFMNNFIAYALPNGLELVCEEILYKKNIASPLVARLLPGLCRRAGEYVLTYLDTEVTDQIFNTLQSKQDYEKFAAFNAQEYYKIISGDVLDYKVSIRDLQQLKDNILGKSKSI